MVDSNKESMWADPDPHYRTPTNTPQSAAEEIGFAMELLGGTGHITLIIQANSPEKAQAFIEAMQSNKILIIQMDYQTWGASLNLARPNLTSGRPKGSATILITNSQQPGALLENAPDLYDFASSLYII